MRPLIQTIIILTGILLFSPTSYADDGNELLDECVQAEKYLDTKEIVDMFSVI